MPEVNRIAAAYTTGNLWGETFQIDPWGNLNKILPYAGKPQAENLNQMAGPNNRFTGMSYDAAGNLLSDGLSNYGFNAENQITTGAGVTYTYDGDGRRVKKSNGKLYWYGMGSDPITETDLTGTPSAEFIFFNGKRTARLDLPSATVHYYFSDHLGSASVVTSATGTIQDESDYYPFGKERVVTDSDPNNYKFTGKERDSESGLDDFGARYDSSNLGRFMSPDGFKYATSVDPQTWNLYSYVANNPLNRIDPTGHDWFWIDGKWQWQKGHKYIDPNTHKVVTDKKGKPIKGYEYLLKFEKTGTNSQGAAVGKLTLYDQDKAIASSTGFSGGSDSNHNGLANGGYMIRLDIHGKADSANDVSQVGNNEYVLKPFYGVQEIPTDTPAPGGGTLNFQVEWGTRRAALNPMPGETSEGYYGNYLHGKLRPLDYTHNCICDRSEAMMDKLLTLGPVHVPVEVQ
jgi:RHS repeat-associated protein